MDFDYTNEAEDFEIVIDRDDNMNSYDIVFSLCFAFITFCIIAPPEEFVSAGLTLQNILDRFLGSEQLNFVRYHMKRVSFTIILHSLVPILYYITLGWVNPFKMLYKPWECHFYWQIYFMFAISLPILTISLVWYWHNSDFDNHPIALKLSHLSNNSNWRSVESSINTEFRRPDKFTHGSRLPGGRRIIVSDSWVIKTSTYTLYVAHQSDIDLTLSNSQLHFGLDNLGELQMLNIDVLPRNKKIKAFQFSLKSIDFNDLKDKLQKPVKIAHDIVIQQSISERFLTTFRKQVELNERYLINNNNVEIEQCLGCMRNISNVKILKLCNRRECAECFCRPMWCLDCMGKWWASRQDQNNTETWLSSKCPCPTCRAPCCILDICLLE